MKARHRNFGMALIASFAISVGTVPSVAFQEKKPQLKKNKPSKPVPQKSGKIFKPKPIRPTKPPAAKPKVPVALSSVRLLEVLPQPATVLEQTSDKKSGISSAWLSNGVRVHHRFTEEAPGNLTASVALAGGEVEETQQTKANTLAASLGIMRGYTDKHSQEDLAKFMAGKNIQMSVSTGYGPFAIEMASPAQYFDSALEKLHVLLMDGKISDSAIEAQREKSLRDLRMFSKVAHFHAVGALNDLISGGDPRRTLANETVIYSQSVASAQAWFDRLRKTAPIEVAVVGDIEFDAALKLVARYIGSLPDRPRPAWKKSKQNTIVRPTGPLHRKVEFAGTIDQSMLFAGLITCDARNSHDRRALQIAALILDERVKRTLRGPDKLATTLSVRSESMWRYADSDRFTAIARCKPKDAEKLAKEIFKMFDAFAARPARPKEFAKANRQWIQYYRSGAFDNMEHWLRLLQYHDMYGRNHAEEFEAWKIYDGLTPESVQAVFKKYYKPENQHVAYSSPRTPEVIKPKEAKKP